MKIISKLTLMAGTLSLLSAIPVHAGVFLNGIAVNGIAVNGIAVNGIAVNGIAVNGIAVNGANQIGLVETGSKEVRRIALNQVKITLPK